ncbi:trypsin-like serine peptidase [Brachybacterium muris]|uniref:Peptidase n=1 Tax=Brachybacterium muris UCD-AY4 TaxID=1249481 RepID=A0A022KQ25_9MICO|nr:hypothetical protein [Brachybacterium muris]EYT47923.1 hypothetical protein D641_0114145 [Brachybacterium muris UCD-AY4]MCT1654887.1 hypothetical protein [Brachybacterium muris]
MSHASITTNDRTRCSSRIRNGVKLAGGAAFALTLSLSSAGLAGADPITRPGMDRTTLSDSAQDEAVEYWTEERMEEATPADELVEDKGAAPAEVERDSEHLKVPAVSPSDLPQTAAETVPGSGDVAGTDHIGKVFFTVGGADYVCSGNSVASTNGSTVSTAGHCTSSGGAWATNWVFAPGYDHGETPHGLWAATEIVSTDQWVSSEDINYDLAFAKVQSDTATGTLAETVGASGIAFNEERGLEYSAYGYPAQSPFDGEGMEQCHGTASDDTLGGTQSQGIDCDMTGGSSGGPWFIGGDAGGYQNSVNSFGYKTQANVMYGPYFGDEAKQAYQEAEVA